MSRGKDYMHSHSALERELKLPKHVVLVDGKYFDRFDSEKTDEVHINIEGQEYVFLKVQVMDFVRRGGVFKNLMS